MLLQHPDYWTLHALPVEQSLPAVCNEAAKAFASNQAISWSAAASAI